MATRRYSPKILEGRERQLVPQSASNYIARFLMRFVGMINQERKDLAKYVSCVIDDFFKLGNTADLKHTRCANLAIRIDYRPHKEFVVCTQQLPSTCKRSIEFALAAVYKPRQTIEVGSRCAWKRFAGPMVESTVNLSS